MEKEIELEKFLIMLL